MYYLREDGDVIDAVVVAERAHEAIAEAGLADPDLALVLLRAGQADHRHIYALHVVVLARHCCASPVRRVARIVAGKLKAAGGMSRVPATMGETSGTPLGPRPRLLESSGFGHGCIAQQLWNCKVYCYLLFVEGIVIVACFAWSTVEGREFTVDSVE